MGVNYENDPVRLSRDLSDSVDKLKIGAAIADAETSHLAATTTELDALGTKINQILAHLRVRRIIDS